MSAIAAVAQQFKQAGELAAWCQENRIDPAVAMEIARIEREAIEGLATSASMGPRFWPVDQRGLAAVMDAGGSDGRRRSDYRGRPGTDFILKLKRDIQRFYRRQ